jgi:hypothetical protein
MCIKLYVNSPAFIAAIEDKMKLLEEKLNCLSTEDQADFVRGSLAYRNRLDLALRTKARGDKKVIKDQLMYLNSILLVFYDCGTLIDMKIVDERVEHVKTSNKSSSSNNDGNSDDDEDSESEEIRKINEDVEKKPSPKLSRLFDELHGFEVRLVNFIGLFLAASIVLTFVMSELWARLSRNSVSHNETKCGDPAEIH